MTAGSIGWNLSVITIFIIIFLFLIFLFGKDEIVYKKGNLKRNILSLAILSYIFYFFFIFGQNILFGKNIDTIKKSTLVIVICSFPIIVLLISFLIFQQQNKSFFPTALISSLLYFFIIFIGYLIFKQKKNFLGNNSTQKALILISPLLLAIYLFFGNFSNQIKIPGILISIIYFFYLYFFTKLTQINNNINTNTNEKDSYCSNNNPFIQICSTASQQITKKVLPTISNDYINNQNLLWNTNQNKFLGGKCWNYSGDKPNDCTTSNDCLDDEGNNYPCIFPWALNIKPERLSKNPNTQWGIGNTPLENQKVFPEQCNGNLGIDSINQPALIATRLCPKSDSVLTDSDIDKIKKQENSNKQDIKFNRYGTYITILSFIMAIPPILQYYSLLPKSSIICKSLILISISWIISTCLILNGDTNPNLIYLWLGLLPLSFILPSFISSKNKSLSSFFINSIILTLIFIIIFLIKSITSFINYEKAKKDGEDYKESNFSNPINFVINFKKYIGISFPSILIYTSLLILLITTFIVFSIPKNIAFGIKLRTPSFTQNSILLYLTILILLLSYIYIILPFTNINDTNELNNKQTDINNIPIPLPVESSFKNIYEKIPPYLGLQWFIEQDKKK